MTEGVVSNRRPAGLVVWPTELPTLRSLTGAGVWLALALALAVCGVAVVTAPRLIGVLVGLAVAGFVASNWRRGVGVLVGFLPFAGLPVFFLNTSYAPVVKDLVLVVPLYAAFFGGRLLRHERLLPGGDPVPALLGMFATVALVYAPFGPTLTAAAIGLKVWLFYLPLYVIGRAYVRDADDVARIVRRLSRLALIPAALALGELYFFVATGSFGPLQALYGRFSDGIVQQVGYGVTIPRIPSTFTFAGSYYDFGLVAVAAALANWAYSRSRGSAVTVVVLALATMASGERRSYFVVPLLVVIALALMRTGAQTKLRALLAGLVALMALIALGVPVVGLSSRLQASASESIGAASQQLTPALQHGLIGHGTGSATNAALRYTLTTTTAGYAESWYTKALIELGYVGLAVVLAVMVVLLVRGYDRIRAPTHDSRMLAAPLWALLFVVALMLVKASELDWDPLDAYFWLLAGMLTALVTRQPEAEPSGRG